VYQIWLGCLFSYSVPTEEFYKGLDLAETVERMAEHHDSAERRHISHFEYQALVEAARRLRSGRSTAA
jgi:hypothetical protein